MRELYDYTVYKLPVVVEGVLSSSATCTLYIVHGEDARLRVVLAALAGLLVGGLGGDSHFLPVGSVEPFEAGMWLRKVKKAKTYTVVRSVSFFQYKYDIFYYLLWYTNSVLFSLFVHNIFML